MICFRILIAAVFCLSLIRPAWATFSIVARDAVTGEMGYAVASRVLATRGNGSGAEAGVGVVARQADLNIVIGRRVLELLRAGRSAQEVLEQVIREQFGQSYQLAILDNRGGLAVSTGKYANPWSGHRIGNGYSVQGNLLVGPQVIEAMASAFEAATGTLSHRLLVALEAGDKAGGDKRGRQSAYLLVVKPVPVKSGTDTVVDLGVDDHVSSITELRRLFDFRRGLDLSSTSDMALGKKDFKRALQIMEEAAALAPHPSLRIGVGVYMYLTGNHDGALDHLRLARKEDPAFDFWWASWLNRVSISELPKDKAFVAKVTAP